MKPEKTSVPIDKAVFWPALLCVSAVIITLGIFPEASEEKLKGIFTFTTTKLGFLYLWFTAACFGMLIWFAFGKYGQIKFGDEDTKPEFSTVGWISMLFCAGVGTSLMYWSTIEWVYYYQSPPFGIEPKTAEAAHWAAMYGLFHWGPSAWAL
jgi:BCCT family betaine/carnitine transporter